MGKITFGDVQRFKNQQIEAGVAALPPGYIAGFRLTLSGGRVTVGAGVASIGGRAVKTSPTLLVESDWAENFTGGGAGIAFTLYLTRDGVFKVSVTAPSFSTADRYDAHPAFGWRAIGRIFVDSTDTITRVSSDYGSDDVYHPNNVVIGGDLGVDGTADITGALTAPTLDTGQGANELYGMDQDVKTTSAVTFATVDTGQGANELYDMDQNVLTTSNVTFNECNLTGELNIDGNLAVSGVGPITNAVRVYGEYMLTEDHELDYSSSITDSMSAATITFSELPADTVAILVQLDLANTGVACRLGYSRSSGGTETYNIWGQYADGGTNRLQGAYWLATSGNSIYVTTVTADTTSNFKIIGYKVGG